MERGDSRDKCGCFWQKHGGGIDNLVSLEQNSQSKKLKENTFNNLKYCNLLSKRVFQRQPGLKPFSFTGIEN